MEAEAEAQAGEIRDVEIVDVQEVKAKAKKRDIGKGAGIGKLEGRLIQAEQRATGSVSWSST